ncbi:ABC-F family ATP-binding cassette domain-containing protein [Eubacterium sp. MSJ-33]|uniref:ABC-F family ATP-binding cassette domain-containing protein n=1 Tax=Eubacterium sp. MSJ-33 TaxID=2841528 RepID=UPI001C77646B|nr:ABC-F family ATP-binding cassette domain-containing protein [Eubacterium sp. MSJ-33]QWT54002.1 ABC-F family ATP-binding cassette domain-containing protein [Eubacterium sp. MSJ-33]
MLLACQNISKAFGTKEILRDVNFHVNEKEKIAIVGINGSGKTTLLKIIMGEETADNGQIILAKDTAIGYLSQHQDISFDNTIYGEMLAAKQYIVDLEANIRRLEHDMKHAEGEELENILEAYNRLSSKYDRDNGYSYESEITGVLKGLGFGPDDYDRHINTLSGGQKMRIALGRLLLTRPDIIILDEPTNHLDMPSISWLESFLSSYPGSVIIVSHDRYFIDRIATSIIEIDNKKATVYHGNYTYYAEKRAEIRANMMKAYLNQQQEIKHQEAVITKLKQFNREKSIKRAESREKMLDKVEVLDKPAEIASEMRLSLEPSVESGNDVLTVTHLSKSFGNNCLFDNLDFDIKRGEKVALIGGNGTGKTTILKMINHIVTKDNGTITLGSRVHIGYYDQEHQVLSLHKTIFEEISDAYPDLTNTKIRNVLAAFLFTGDDVFKKIEDLSGGERGRVSLAKLMLSPANFLVLDEPTNHLDIQSKGILEDAIRNYTGTVLVVSHDRYFINRIATRILELKDQQLYSFIGNYDYYEAHKELIYEATVPKQAFNSSMVAASTPVASSKDDYKKQKEEQARLRKKENDIKKAEQKIEQTEAEITKIDEEFLNPDFATNSAKLSELSKKREELESTLSALYETWETLLD